VPAQFARCRQALAPLVGRLLTHLVANDVVAQLDALVADEHRRAGDELAHLVLALAAERAVQKLFAVAAALFVVHNLTMQTAVPARRCAGGRRGLKTARPWGRIYNACRRAETFVWSAGAITSACR
jgi:hypothetical protein